ncbi:MAG: endonuclease/exonuclease/phosphatase family protein [Chloroflexota bacterium]|nr:MAG: endonuclease/exonuclease/phosphatase family protein [Chloroflexota bacterium]
MPRKTKAPVKKDRLFIFIEWLAARPLLTELTLTAITVLFGMQVLRVLIPGTFWALGDQIGWSAMELGIIGGLIVLAGFLAGPLGWLIGNRRLVAVTAIGLGLIRLFMQVSWQVPLFNLSLALIGTIFFVIFIPACFEDARLRGSPAMSRFALGLLGGLALDIAINGAFDTYDIIWQVAPLPVLLTLLLLIIQLVLTMGTTPTIMTTPTKPSSTKTKGVSMARSFAWLAIGPFLFLELVIFQNIPRVAVLTGWTLPIAFGLTLLAQLAGIVVAACFLSRSWRMLWLWAFSAGVILIASLVFAYQKPAALIALLFLVGQVLASVLIVMVLIGITTSTGKTQRSVVWLANGIGIALFLGLIFAYYAVYHISLPYHNIILEIIAGGTIAVCAISALNFWQQDIKVAPKLWLMPILALILLVLPLAQTIMRQTPTAITDEYYPVSVMTYNLNNGFNTKGKLNIEEIAQVIENNNPDIVALQEVSRGWVINGRLDMLEWLSQRLHMPYKFVPTADQFVGNAILSRYPILSYSKQDLPSPELLMPSNLTVALIEIGESEHLKVITTDLHPGNDDENVAIRLLQCEYIADFLNDITGGRIVLLGSINAEPDDSEIRTLRQVMLMDAASRIDPELAYTFASDNPHQRIDYIFTSYDIRTTDVQVPLSIASDHLPVVAVIYE